MPVTAALLEDRINQYINAVDGASAAHDVHQVSQLQKDIQQLVDLMERVNSGHTIPESVIPPPLVIAPPIGFVPNPMNELASRLSNYHKALYFAEEELSDKRMQKIQRLQQGLQILNDLQRNVEAGYPVSADEIPPPVPIPSDDEFDNNAVETISERISSYKAALLAAEQSTTARDRKHIPKLQSAVRTLEFLMTRAKANRPVWKRDIPPEYEYHDAVPLKSTSKMNKTKFMLMLRAQLLQVGRIKFTSLDNQQKVKELLKKLSDMEKEISAQNSVLKENEALLTALTKQTDELEKLSIAEQQNDSHQIIADSKVLVETRIKEYMASALAYKKNNQVNEVLKLFKIVKTLRALKESLDNGELIDLSLIPPPLTTEQQTEQSSSAAADLSPVIIKPVIETEEDRLAKKLSQYLELGDEGALYGQKSSVSNVNLNQAQTTGVLPKVPNALRNVTTQSSTDSLIQSANHTISLSTETNCEHPKSFDEHICNTEDGPSLDIQNGHLQDLEVNKSISLSAGSHLGHPQSTDIYTRKTLDSVGFLPCQNVPEHEQVKVIPVAAVNAVEDQSMNTSVPLVYPESSQMSELSDSSILGLSELNFQQTDCKSNAPSSLNLSVAHSEDFVSSKFFSLPVVLSQSVETLPDVKSHFLGPSSNTVTSTDKQLISSLLLQNTNLTLQSKSNKVLQSENINSKVQNFYSTLNESSEFQDLMDSMVMPTPVNNAPAKLSEASMTHIEMNANVGSETTLNHSFTDTKTSSKNIENSSDLTYAESRNQLYQKNSLSDIKDQNFTFQKYIPSVTSAGQPSAWLNSNIPLDNTIKNSFLTQSQNPVGSQTTCVQDYTSHTEYDSLSNSVEFTCIENLKYDFLIKEAKESAECQEEALSLRHRFEEIKKILLTGSFEIWEEYKSCVESELASFIKQIETLRVHHRWSEMRILSEKKQIAERELAILRERLPELKI